MNKIVSNNPVQRFKDGKKIIKAQSGSPLPKKFFADGKHYERYGNDYWDVTLGSKNAIKVNSSNFNWRFNNKTGKYEL